MAGPTTQQSQSLAILGGPKAVDVPFDDEPAARSHFRSERA